MKMLRVFVIWCVLMCKSARTMEILRNQLDSPCPDIFQYKMDESNLLYGVMGINSPSGINVIQINMELSVGNRVEGYNGNIELAYSKEKVLEDIMHHRPILYKVFFPFWRNIPPKVTRIFVNGNLVCSGSKIAINLVQVLTTITLQHTLTINVSPLSALLPNDNPVPPDNRFDTRPQNRPTSNKPIVDFDVNNIGNIQNNINFKPQMPKDPSNIYSGNPFINVINRNNSSNHNNNIPTTSVNPFFSLAPTPSLDDRYRPPAQETTAAYQKPTASNHVSPSPEFPARGGSSGKPYADVCGRPIATNSLIVDGLDVPKGAYPWLSAIFRVQNTGLTYICSASLVSNRHIVTAAHCVQKDSRKVKPQDLLIILGKLNIAKWVPSPGERMIEPDSIHVHPNYTPSSSDADIAVIELSEVVTFSVLIRPICLWDGPDSLSSVVGTQGVVAGWGKNEAGLISTAEPKQTFLPIVDQETCLRSSHQFQYITSNRTFCAGFRNGSGPCNGDSGSGMIIKRNEVWMLRGIVSMSISDTHSRTCDLGHYVVFTDASKFVPWLASFLT